MIRRDNAQFALEVDVVSSAQPVIAQGASLVSTFSGF
jgi:hypothetical protein